MLCPVSAGILHLLLIFPPVFVRFFLLATTSIAQGFFVALFSGITPGGLKVELGLAMCKISALPAGTGFCQFCGCGTGFLGDMNAMKKGHYPLPLDLGQVL